MKKRLGIMFVGLVVVFSMVAAPSTANAFASKNNNVVPVVVPPATATIRSNGLVSTSNITAIRFHVSNTSMDLRIPGIELEQYAIMKGLTVGRNNYTKLYVYGTKDNVNTIAPKNIKWYQIQYDWCTWGVITTSSTGVITKGVITTRSTGVITSVSSSISVDQTGVVSGLSKTGYQGEASVTALLTGTTISTSTNINVNDPTWLDQINQLIGRISGAILSYWYNDVDNYFYTEAQPWQRKLGYSRLYDFGSQFTGFSLDTIRLTFSAQYCDSTGTNCPTKDWMLQLWKGVYGITVGSEIGLYNIRQNPWLDLYLYKCNDDNNLLNMSMTLYQSVPVGPSAPKGQLKLYSTPDDELWWATGFKVWYDTYDKASVASMNANDFTTASVYWNYDNKYFVHPNPELTMLARITIPQLKPNNLTRYNAGPINKPITNDHMAKVIGKQLSDKGFIDVSSYKTWTDIDQYKDINNWPDAGPNQFIIAGSPTSENYTVYIKWNYAHDGNGF